MDGLAHLGLAADGGEKGGRLFRSGPVGEIDGHLEPLAPPIQEEREVVGGQDEKAQDGEGDSRGQEGEDRRDAPERIPRSASAAA